MACCDNFDQDMSESRSGQLHILFFTGVWTVLYSICSPSLQGKTCYVITAWWAVHPGQREAKQRGVGGGIGARKGGWNANYNASNAFQGSIRVQSSCGGGKNCVSPATHGMTRAKCNILQVKTFHVATSYTALISVAVPGPTYINKCCSYGPCIRHFLSLLLFAFTCTECSLLFLKCRELRVKDSLQLLHHCWVQSFCCSGSWLYTPSSNHKSQV